jgi:hypothetical protein
MVGIMKDNNQSEQFNLELLPKDGEKLLDALKAERMVVVRSKNDFMYILLRGGTFHMFMHTPGSPDGGQNKFPEDEKYTAIVKNFANLSELAVAVTFDGKSMNLYNVMASAEEAILTEFPGDDRDADEIVDFTPPTATDNGDDPAVSI